MLKPRVLGTFLLLLLCSCATEKSIHSQLPSDVKMNKDAGRGSLIMVTLRLADGEKVPMLLDTGASITCLDKSLAPKLGKRLRTVTGWKFGEPQEIDLYATPKLFLGKTPLMTGSNIMTMDCGQLPPWVHRPVLGILGMDCMAHYCFQLDFTSHKIHFLNDEHSNKEDWGNPFTLHPVGKSLFGIRENLAGLKGSDSLIDTGCSNDGWLVPKLFQQWTNQAISVLAGETYSEMDVLEKELQLTDDPQIDCNGIGLRFLSRHLVTFDCPNRTLYLKRTSLRPLIYSHN